MNPVVIVFAVKRLTDVIVEDEVARPVRQRINRWAQDAPEFSVRERLATLVGCERCTSVWAAAAIMVAARVRWLRPLVALLAASQASLITADVWRVIEGKVRR